jgi:hypothetical protein
MTVMWGHGGESYHIKRLQERKKDNKRERTEERPKEQKGSFKSRKRKSFLT